MEQPALWQRCMAKRHRLAHWKSRHPPMGGGGAGSVLADLVILIDTSASMADEAEQLNKILGAAVTTARQSCASDLRVEWLGIEDTHPNTEFRQTVRGSLLKLDGVSPDLPVAVIERGTTADARVLRTLLTDLGDLVTREEVKSPALIIVGAVAARADALDCLGAPALAAVKREFSCDF